MENKTQGGVEIVETDTGLERKLASTENEVLCRCDGTAISVLKCIKTAPSVTPLEDTEIEHADNINMSYLLEMMWECSKKGLIKLGKKAAPKA